MRHDVSTGQQIDLKTRQNKISRDWLGSPLCSSTPHVPQLSALSFLKQTKHAVAYRDYTSKLADQRRCPADACQFMLLTLVTIALVVFWFGQVTGGVFATEVMTDGLALWSSR